MKADKVVRHEVLITAEQIAAEAKIDGEARTQHEGDRTLFAVRTPARVRIPVPRENLEPMNTLAVNLRLVEPFAGSLVTQLSHTTRHPGIAVADRGVSIMHFHQPDPWRDRWQRVAMPDVNFAPTGFPDGWKHVEAVELDLHGRGEQGWVILGDIEAMAVRRPRGPRMTDAELLDALDLERPELRAVARRAERGDVDAAVAAYARVLRRRKLPKDSPALVPPHVRPSSADQICRHEIMEQQLPRQIDWHANPIGYLEWNHAFNRQTWFSTLAEAFEETGRRKYARKLDYFARSWVRQNPEPVGHNGGLDPAWETLSTSLRLDWAWHHVLRVARASRDVADRTLIDLAKSVHGHAEHLLAWHGHCNWFVAESTALVAAATFWPGFRRAGHWMRTGIERLEAEMRAQVFPDGAQYELSPNYHQMCAGLFYWAWRWAEFRGDAFSETFTRRLWGMWDYLAAIRRPDGTFPVPNDAGCALRRDAERMAQVGRAARRADWVWAGTGAAEGKPPAKVGSICFPDAGHAIMRSGWSADDRWAFFDMGRFGAAHQHEDMLQVELYAHGTPFLLDPGISSYQADPVVRHFRTSQAHNTLTVDGFGQWRRRSGDRRRWESSSRGTHIWAAGRGLDLARGTYSDAYGDGDATVLEGLAHTRTLVFVRPDYWLVLDRLAGPGMHTAEALWHFAPMHVRVDAESATVRTQRLSKANLELICRGDWADGELRLATGVEQPEVQGFVAVDDEVKPAPCAIVGRRQALPIHGVTVAVPFDSGSESHFRVATEPVTGRNGAGMLVTIERPGGVTDRFLWRHTGSGLLAAGGVRSNGDLGLVRTDADAQVVYAAIVDGGSVRYGRTSLKGKAGRLAETS